MDTISVGFDLGATNFRAAVFQGLAHAARDITEVPTTPPLATVPLASFRERIGEERSPEMIVERIAAAVPRLLREAEVGGLDVPVGIGFAGMLRGRQGFVANAPNFGWTKVEFGRMLQRKLGERYRVGLYNDVNAICYGEYAFGAGVGASDLLAIFIGTGIGCGAVVDGKLLYGAHNAGTELGHFKVSFDEQALPCHCGLRGCLEAYAGGLRLQMRVRDELSRGAKSLAVELAGAPEYVNPSHIDKAAAQGDDYALALYDELGPMIAASIANGITLLNPQRLVLGGGMLSRTPVLREYILAAFPLVVNPPAYQELEVSDALLGDDSGLVGAALLAGL